MNSHQPLRAGRPAHVVRPDDSDTRTSRPASSKSDSGASRHDLGRRAGTPDDTPRTRGGSPPQSDSRVLEPAVGSAYDSEGDEVQVSAPLHVAMSIAQKTARQVAPADIRQALRHDNPKVSRAGAGLLEQAFADFRPPQLGPGDPVIHVEAPGLHPTPRYRQRIKRLWQLESILAESVPGGARKTHLRQLIAESGLPLSEASIDALATHALQLRPASNSGTHTVTTAADFEWNSFDLREFDLSRDEWKRLAEAAERGDLATLDGATRALSHVSGEAQNWLVTRFIKLSRGERPPGSDWQLLALGDLRRARATDPTPYFDWQRHALDVDEGTSADLRIAARYGNEADVFEVIDADRNLACLAPQVQEWLAEAHVRHAAGERPHDWKKFDFPPHMVSETTASHLWAAAQTHDKSAVEHVMNAELGNLSTSLKDWLVDNLLRRAAGERSPPP